MSLSGWPAESPRTFERRFQPAAVENGSNALAFTMVRKMRVDVWGRTKMNQAIKHLQKIRTTPDWWCRIMHSKVSLPRDNCYRCLKCGRVYLVPWVDRPQVSVEPAPGSSLRGLRKLLGLIHVAFAPHPEFPGRVGTANDGD